ncbi:MAG: fibrillarin-like rRNA/tRNA 2'-O-methyltransferase [Candidatus Thermoplasmatota archaeon]|nr:fibrillarin-like rRNA/tRNA 2'-O-methyltransferase [Candidatus Thermoplasmatota archaeon]
MKERDVKGVFTERNRIFTKNLQSCRGITVYGERLIKHKNEEFRSWNPYKSKLAAAILKGLSNINLSCDSHILYLGAATGTTVSHISDIAKEGAVYAVEKSPFAVKDLLELSKKRENIMPILSDANHPDRYSTIVPTVDFLYQDISQRNQSEIFINNVNRYLKKNGQGIIMVKARSIDVSIKPKKIYELITGELKKHKLTIVDIIDISHYEKDHAAIVISV